MKTFNATFKKGSKGAFAISLVKDPATTEHFIALSKQPELVQLAEIDKEQRIVMGLVLQPKQLIPRYNEETQEEFNIVFSEETIKDLSQNFFIANNQSNSKLEHQTAIDEVTIVESWIIENSEIDKSANFGMNFPKGSWMATMKINNDKIWNDYVKTGEVQGFSVDAFVDLEEINLKTEVKMSKLKSILTMLTEVVSSESETNQTEVTLGSVKSGDLDIQFEGEEIAVGSPVFVMNEDEKVSLPDGSYKLDDSDKEIVVKDGSVESMEVIEVIEEEVAEEMAEETVEEAETAPEVIEEEVAEVEGELEMIEKLLKDMFDAYTEKMFVQMSDMKLDFDAKLGSLSQENVELKAELVTLSKTPADKVIRTAPSQKIGLTKQERILNVVKATK
tara:strand:+ start:9944 stop:11113 length:1170 start_codon:yes stop_codon:yes gene_type:complete